MLLFLLAGCSHDMLPVDTGGDTSSNGLPAGDRHAVSAVTSGSSLAISVRLWEASTCDINGDGYDDAILDAYDSGTDMVAYGSASGLGTPSTITLQASSTRTSERGACVGDVNSDGYDDVYATDWNATKGSYISGTTGYEGFIALYYGGASGLQTTAASTAWGSGRSYNLGSRPTRFGDLDGDGLSEWGYGIPGYDGGETDEGAVVVEYSRLAFDTTIQADVAGAGIGYCTGGVGDVNGDGYGDLMVCTAGAYTDTVGSGSLRLYYGSASGVSTTPDWVGSSSVYVTTGAASYGDVLAGGDFDGDGYADVAVAAMYSGGVDIWYGTSAGLDTTPNTTVAYLVTIPHVEIADVDADGYADLVIAEGFTSSCDTDGAFTVYRGGSSGLSSTADYSVSGPEYGTYAVTAGDFDADGAADVLLPVTRTTGSCYNTLNAKVFYGVGVDTDSDGVFDNADCAPSDSSIYTGATESCDAVDSDCDDDLVDGASDLDGDGTPDCIDSDVDGDGDPGATDCDDADATVFRGAPERVDDGIDQDCDGGDTCLADADADGYAAEGLTLASADLDCADLGEARASVPATDCDDADPSRSPAIPEITDDRVDSDCDGSEVCYADGDNDGYRAVTGTVISADLDCTDAREAASADPAVDCDDTSSAIHPGATEGVGNGVDSDCDGGEICYADADDDGYVDDGGGTVVSADIDCTDAGEGTNRDPATDCDDGAASVNPAARETAGDGTDGDCDGAERCYIDGDSDGYGSSGTVVSADLDCADAGEAAVSGDCATADSAISPGATEVCDAADTDEDCDELADDDDGSLDSTTRSVWYRDVDGDTYGDAGSSVEACDAPRFYVADGSDCDDAALTVYPGAPEAAGDGRDADCDGAETCYVDADGDGQREAGGATVSSANLACDGAGEAAASAVLDCDDADRSVYDGAPEVLGDGVDQDCDGGDLCALDADGDGHGGSETLASADRDCDDRGEAAVADDCDDDVATVYTGAAEVPGDGIDEDCDGAERCYADEDSDGFRTDAEVDSDDLDCAGDGEADDAAPAGDCDDADPAAWPGAEEVVADGVDADCDGGERCWTDTDGDGAGVPVEIDSDDLSCSGAGVSAADDDCDDGDATSYPGAEEVVADGIDEDCDGGELCWADADHDGFGAADGSTVPSPDLACTDPGEYGQPPTDCDDLAEAAHPGATEVEGNDVDEDCDGEAAGAAAADGEPEAPAEGCGCAAEPGASGSGLVALGALVVLARRRRSVAGS